MDSEREGISADFSYAKLAEDFLKYKNKGALIDAFHKLDFRTLNNLAYANLELKPIYDNEVRKNIKENNCNKIEDIIIKALYKLEQSPETFNHQEEMLYLDKICNEIINNSFSDNLKINEINNNLTIIEKNLRAIPLYASYTKAYFYTFLHISKNKNKNEIH